VTAKTNATMRAVAVISGKPDSLNLREVRRPLIGDVPDGRGVLVDVIRVGACGTDREIVDALFGTAPAGDDFLVIGHENLGRVAEVGENVTDGLRPGALVVATVRRPGTSIYDTIGLQDMTTDEARERGINRLHGYLAEAYVDDVAFLVPLPDSLEPVGVLLEPLSIAEKGIRQAFEIQRGCGSGIRLVPPCSGRGPSACCRPSRSACAASTLPSIHGVRRRIATASCSGRSARATSAPPTTPSTTSPRPPARST
jgi:hypothetical protein